MKWIFLALFFGLVPSLSSALYPFPWIIQTGKGYVFNSSASFSEGLSKDSTIKRAIQFKKTFRSESRVLLLSEDEGKNQEIKDIVDQCKKHGYRSFVVLRIKAQSDSIDLDIFDGRMVPIDSVPKEFLTWRDWMPVSMDELESSAIKFRAIAEKRINGILDHPQDEPLNSSPIRK